MHTETVARELVVHSYLILEWCCAAPLAVMPGRAAPLGVEIDAVVVRVPSHVVPVHMECHSQWRRHLHAPSLVLASYRVYVPASSHARY